MAQRASLARALVNEPAVLLLDEPLANLDSLTRIAMQAELIALWQRERFTAFLVTHDVEEALYLAEAGAGAEPPAGADPGRNRRSICRIRGIAAIPSSPNCAIRCLGCWGWTPLGSLIRLCRAGIAGGRKDRSRCSLRYIT